MKVDVIILAGAKNQGALKACSQHEYEALIEINNAPMIEYVLYAVRMAKYVERVAVVGPTEALRPLVGKKIDFLIEDKGKIVDNIIEGLNVLQSNRKVLIITSDIPLISSDTIDNFIAECESINADVYYPIISKEANQCTFPDSQRTYARLREGTYTGGNIFIIQPKVLDNAAEFLRKLVIWRKKPIKLSQLFGIKFILKFVLGLLTISELEERVYKITGFTAAALIFDYPEIGFDVDKPSDLNLIEKYLKLAN